MGIFSAYSNKNGVQVALGDINGDKQLEIAALPVYGEPHLKIFNLKGKLLKEYWLGFTTDRFFYDLTMADVNADKLAEILVTKW